MTTMTREEALTIVTSIVREHSRECREPKPCQDCELEAEAIAALSAQNNKRPVDHIALAMELATAGAAYANAHPDASMIECMAQALREVLP